MLRKLMIASCLGVFALSMAACNGPGEIKVVPTADQERPGDPGAKTGEDNNGAETSWQ